MIVWYLLGIGALYGALPDLVKNAQALTSDPLLWPIAKGAAGLAMILAIPWILPAIGITY